MDFPSTSPSRHRSITLWLLGIGLVIYTFLLIKNVGASAGGSDSSGYLNHARMLASGNLHAPPRMLEGLPPNKMPSYAYVPLGFRPAAGTGDLVPTYPPGLPLMVLAAHLLVGWSSAGDVVMVLHTLAALLVVFLLGRRFGLGEGWSLFLTAVVATSPVFVFMSLQAMSDVPSLVWVGVTVLCALRARESTRWALAAGAAFSVCVLLRPTNTLMIIPVAIALGFSPRRWALLILAGIPGAVYWMLYAKAAYGSPFTTGYGDVATQFSRDYVAKTLVAYAAWIPTMFTPISVLFLGLPFVARGRSRETAILLAWALICPLFYVSYYCTNETWWYERFLLPGLPAMLIGGLLVVRAVAARWLDRPSPRVAWTGAAIVLASSLSWGYFYEAGSIGRGERNYSHVADWMNASLPPDAVLAVMQASGAVFYYTDFKLVRWDALDEGGGNAFGRVAASVRAHHHPLYAVLFPFEQDIALHQRMAGPWKFYKNVRGISVYEYDFSKPDAPKR